MCRLLGFRCNTQLPLAFPLLDAPNALVKQSQRDSRGEDHPDGWGIGYYSKKDKVQKKTNRQSNELVREEYEAVVHKSALPAFTDAAFNEYARNIFATHAIAHVRAASVGNAALRNTHPFHYQNWLWAHNGTVRPFAVIYQDFLQQIDPEFLALRQGDTDSELCFLLFLSELAKRAPTGMNYPLPEVALSSLRRAVQRILRLVTPHPTPKPSGLTFLATNGDLLLAYRHVTTLFVLKKATANEWLAPNQEQKHLSKMGKALRVAVVASEPLTDEAWEEIPNGHGVLIKPNLEVEREDFGLGGFSPIIKVDTKVEAPM